ncbi:hypothetical protein GOBAR_AA26890 [Gossypium barbadense]|uniref:Uncharacterized protein n=1 Tax=Gossypium barbadense TaxID=3634 RepID=A0A2P5WRS5_GOSBA|nr:hypothetical protein GOBAR_AA26890 [Gossypium barbadense]
MLRLSNKEKIEKERARLFFSWQIALVNKILIPGIAPRKFHTMDVIYSDGRKSKLPIVFDASKLAIPEASLVCLSFRANSQAMVDSWGKPFYDAFTLWMRLIFVNRFTRDLLFYYQLQLLRVREILASARLQQLGSTPKAADKLASLFISASKLAKARPSNSINLIFQQRRHC